MKLRPDGFVIPIWDVSFFEDELLQNQFNASNYTNFDLSQADIQILNNSPINATIEYYVTYNDALLSTYKIVGEYFNEVSYNQVVYARVEIDNTYYTINEVSLIVKELPNVLQYEEMYFCLNSFPEIITLEGGILDDIPNNYAYSWSTEETTINIEVNEIGTYTVFVTRPAGCTNMRTVVLMPSSSATVETIEVSDVSEHNTITVLVSGEGDYVYALDDEFGIYQDSNIFENVAVGIHSVFVKDIKAFCGIASEDISVLGFSKFFTPNSDSKNDTWGIKGF